MEKIKELVNEMATINSEIYEAKGKRYKELVLMNAMTKTGGRLWKKNDKESRIYFNGENDENVYYDIEEGFFKVTDNEKVKYFPYTFNKMNEEEQINAVKEIVIAKLKETINNKMKY